MPEYTISDEPGDKLANPTESEIVNTDLSLRSSNSTNPLNLDETYIPVDGRPIIHIRIPETEVAAVSFLIWLHNYFGTGKRSIEIFAFSAFFYITEGRKILISICIYLLH
jgi:hypothetical protein